MSEESELETPPVPPTDFDTYDDPDLSAKILDREETDAECPRCGGTLYVIDRQTGHRVLAFWPDDVGGGAAEYKTSDDWPEVETVERCGRCHWRRTL